MLSKTGYEVVDRLLKTFDDKYKLAKKKEDGTLLPWVICTQCNAMKRLYKWQNGITKSNPRSNIESHVCVNQEGDKQPKIHQMTLKELGSFRSEIATEFSRILLKYPTVSVLSGTGICNDVSNFISNFTSTKKKRFKFDVSRQNVAATTKELAQAKVAVNRDLFKKNYSQSSILIDHWTAHGRNFLAIIARIYDQSNSKVDQILLHFDEANKDHTAKGIYEDIKPYVQEKIELPLPIVFDNCNTMIAVDRYSDGNVFKIYCLEHKLAIINKNLHKKPIFKTLDEKLAQINAYFNYRHDSFNLPLKPPQYSSATRPWRSHLHNYKVILLQANFWNFPENLRGTFLKNFNLDLDL